MPRFRTPCRRGSCRVDYPLRPISEQVLPAYLWALGILAVFGILAGMLNG